MVQSQTLEPGLQEVEAGLQDWHRAVRKSCRDAGRAAIRRSEARDELPPAERLSHTADVSDIEPGMAFAAMPRGGQRPEGQREGASGDHEPLHGLLEPG
ncbi:hypothetical protein CU110_03500 [Cobetia sp. ICG0124]|nr:hypothetical protein CU110_03500 [Cobetia sp. ICG0124]